jgi:hypothetical protein
VNYPIASMVPDPDDEELKSGTSKAASDND